MILIVRKKFRSTQQQVKTQNFSQASKRFEKAEISKKTKFLGMIVCMVLGYYAWQGYLRYQQYQQIQQQKIDEMLLENRQIIEKQRAQHGHLPTQFLSEQGRKNLGM